MERQVGDIDVGYANRSQLSVSAGPAEPSVLSAVLCRQFMMNSVAKGESRGSAFALVITLALIALITFAVVAYFSRTVTNRRIESATSAAVRADTLARAAAQIVVSDLKTEIIAGSELLQPAFDQ